RLIQILSLHDALPIYVPKGAIPKTSVPFPFCIKDQKVYEQVDLYLIPLKSPVVTWDDDRLNHIPTLSVELETNKIARFSRAEIQDRKRTRLNSSHVSI